MKRVFAFIGFTTALTLIILNIVDLSFAALILSISVVLFVASMLIKNTRQARVLPIVLGSIVFACLTFMLVSYSSVLPVKSLDKETVKTELQIVDIPEYNVYTDSYTYTVKTIGIDKSGAPQKIRLKLKSKDEIDCDYYDNITATLSYYSIADNAFDSYSDYGDGVYLRARLKSMENIEQSTTKPVNYYLIKLRENIFSLINSNFKGDTAGCCIALLTGDKSYLSQNMLDDFRNCGISHFFAVSGFHISFVCLSLYSLLKILKVPKAVNTVISLSAMVLYCGIADFSKSSLRACIMLVVLLLSRLFNTKADTLNSLGLATFIICLNPFAVSDAGAALTVSAMLGITVIFRNVFNGHRYGNNFAEKIDAVSVISGCVLLAVMPAMYIFFGNISFGSVFINLFIEPLIVVIIVLLVLFCLFSWITPVSFLLVSIIKPLSRLLFSIVGFCAKRLSFLYENISGEIFGITLAAAFVFIGLLLLVKNKIPVKATAIFISIVLALAVNLTAYESKSSAYVHIASSGMVVVCDKDNAVVIDMDNIYDKNNADNLIAGRRALYIDCGYKYDDVKSDNDYTIQLDENFSLSVNNKIIIINVYNKMFEINSDYVIIGNNSFSRGSVNTTLSFRENSQLAVRRDNDV